MSHVATGKCRIHDLDALDIACDALGLELIRDQTTYQWYGSYLADSAVGRDAVRQGARPADFGKCSHAIRVKGQKGGYEIGIKPALDGKGFRTEYDQWGPGAKLDKIVGGVDATHLQDQYNAAVTARSLARQGYRITQRINEQGELQVVAMKA